MSYVRELRKLIGTRPIILVGSIVLIFNEENQLLLQKRTYPKGVWGLPGGLMELTESTEECARREVLEETGLTIGELELLTVLSGKNLYAKAENGDEFYVVTIVYTTKDIVRGTPRVNDDESLAVQYFSLQDLPKNMPKSHRKAIDIYLQKKATI